MSTDLDTARLVRAWLRAGDGESADRLLDAALAVVETTGQYRPWWRRAPSGTPNYAVPAVLATATVVVVAAIGLVALLSGPQISGPQPAATASPDVTTTPAPTAPGRPSPSVEGALPFYSGGILPAGTYRLGDTGSGTLADAILPPLSFTVPDGWRAWNDNHSPFQLFHLPPDDEGYVWPWDPDASLGTAALTQLVVPGTGFENPDRTAQENYCGLGGDPWVIEPTMVPATLETWLDLYVEPGDEVTDVVVGSVAGKAVTRPYNSAIGLQCPGEPAPPDQLMTRTSYLIPGNGFLWEIQTERLRDLDATVMQDLEGIIDSIRFE